MPKKMYRVRGISPGKTTYSKYYDTFEKAKAELIRLIGKYKAKKFSYHTGTNYIVLRDGAEESKFVIYEVIDE